MVGECGVIVYERNFHSRTRVFHYIQDFMQSFGVFVPYMGANLWYASRLAETYTHIPDMHRAAMIVVTL